MGFRHCLHRWGTTISLGPTYEFRKQAQPPRLPLDQGEYTSPPGFLHPCFKNSHLVSKVPGREGPRVGKTSGTEKARGDCQPPDGTHHCSGCTHCVSLFLENTKLLKLCDIPFWVLPAVLRAWEHILQHSEHSCYQASRGESCARKAAALHGSEGRHSNRLLKKKVLSRLSFNPTNMCMRKDKPLGVSSASQPLQHWRG